MAKQTLAEQVVIARAREQVRGVRLDVEDVEDAPRVVVDRAGNVRRVIAADHEEHERRERARAVFAERLGRWGFRGGT